MGDTIFEMDDISHGENTIQCSSSMSSTMLVNNVRREVSDDDFLRLHNTIQKACDENKLNKLPVFDFIKLYEHRIVALNQQIAMLKNKLQATSMEISIGKQTALRFETTMLKCTEMAKSLQQSNEL